MDKAVMIFRFSDNDRAIEVLRENGVTILDSEAFGILESESRHERKAHDERKS
jgi:hypothetical protein